MCSFRSSKETKPLTQREHQILRLIAEGNQNPDVARKLHISKRTVSAHVGNLMEKLQARTRAEAVAKAYQRGIL